MSVAIIVSLAASLGAGEAGAKAWTLENIHIRDPFILPVDEEKRYYLFGTHASHAVDFPVYWSMDLKMWEGPVIAFEKHEEFWGDREFWAPEVHRHRGRFFMFASFNAPGRRRATQILVADNPQGPYRVHGDGPVTPPDWDCLDGTLFIGEDKQPWIVFCHEWTQTRDGEICARKLSPDLSKAEGDPILLFRAYAAPWVVEVGFGGPRKGFVTDGPFLHRTKEGALLMLWSSFSQKGYVQSYAYSESGHLSGPWVQQKIPWFDEDAGHGMLFRCFDGRQMLVLHRPNGGGRERAHLFEIGESPHELISTPFRF